MSLVNLSPWYCDLQRSVHLISGGDSTSDDPGRCHGYIKIDRIMNVN